MTNAEIYRALGPEFARDYDAADIEWRRSVESAVGAARSAATLPEAVGLLCRRGWGAPELAADIRRLAGIVDVPPIEVRADGDAVVVGERRLTVAEAWALHRALDEATQEAERFAWRAGRKS